jgi:hypothetical protein
MPNTANASMTTTRIQFMPRNFRRRGVMKK